jgi:hypothetical protein
MATLIVPRGETPEYYSFLAITTRVNGDALVVDRRNADRRELQYSSSSERREGFDRRGPAPATWMRHGLIVTDHLQ